MKRRWFVTALAAVSLVFLPALSVAQEERKAEGLQDAVRRDFVAASPGLFDLYFVTTRVAQFDSPQHASEAIGLWFAQRTNPDDELNTIDFSALRPTGVHLIRDETRALAGTSIGADEREYQSALLAVRDASLLYTFETFRGVGSALDDATTIAERLFDLEPREVEPVPGVTYRTGRLWDNLPRLEHLPKGFTLQDENELCVGTFAAYECPPATPEASPSATPVGGVSAGVEGAGTSVSSKFHLDEGRYRVDARLQVGGDSSGFTVHLHGPSGSEESLFNEFIDEQQTWEGSVVATVDEDGEYFVAVSNTDGAWTIEFEPF